MARLIVITTFYERQAALIARSCLEAYGITALVFDLEFSNNRWDYLIAIGCVRLCVLEHETDIARQLLGLDDDGAVIAPMQLEPNESVTSTLIDRFM